MTAIIKLTCKWRWQFYINAIIQTPLVVTLKNIKGPIAHSWKWPGTKKETQKLGPRSDHKHCIYTEDNNKGIDYLWQKSSNPQKGLKKRG